VNSSQSEIYSKENSGGSSVVEMLTRYDLLPNNDSQADIEDFILCVIVTVIYRML
jgi:hypothetical protein